MTPEEDVVNYVIALEGNCCEAVRCSHCPFLQDCSQHMMRDYKQPSADAKAKRVRRALEILTKILMDDHE